MAEGYIQSAVPNLKRAASEFAPSGEMFAASSCLDQDVLLGCKDIRNTSGQDVLLERVPKTGMQRVYHAIALRGSLQ